MKNEKKVNSRKKQAKADTAYKKLADELKKMEPHKVLLEIVGKYTGKGQTVIFLSLDMINIQLQEAVRMPFAEFVPYVQDVDMLLEKVVEKVPENQLESLCSLIRDDIDQVCDMVVRIKVKEEEMMGYGVMLQSLEEILKQVSRMPAEEYDGVLTYSPMGNRVYHFKEIERIAETAMKNVMQSMAATFGM